jgi:hypothetical protein
LSDFDARGARGSNAGDTFHELWAMLHVLELLDRANGPQAVAVEGIPNEPESGTNAPAPTWDGVDCALFYGSKTIESAARVELEQLKYSSANPETDWSVARLCASSAKSKNNSAIRKLATDFSDARRLMLVDAQLVVRFISNKKASDRLQAAVGARWTGPIASSPLSDEIKEDLNALQKGSGLYDDDFCAFIASFDLSGCGTKSRFALREDLVFAVTQLLGDDADPQLSQLLQEVRNLMRPERAREVITERQLLTWFSVTSRESLFPCPPDLKDVSNAIRRAATDEVLNCLKAKERIVLIHGAGGCGKTTLVQQLRKELPTGSISVLFDCFGGGQYIHSDDKRHRPENAFLQIANEIALSLRIPIYIPRSVNHPADIRLLLSKLRIAGRALQSLNPDALLVVIADAADNSVTAATSVEPNDPCFVFDLAQASLNIVGVAPGSIADIANDLWPGLRVRDDAVSIADEDFDQHISEEARPLRDQTTQRVADYFARTCTTHAYSAIHVADALIKAQRGTELLAVVERDPQAAAITDAIVRRQTQLHRLKLSVQAHVGSTNTVDTLKALLLSAEADRDESTIHEVMNAHTDLAAEFGGASYRRQVLLDRDRIHDHGSLLIHDAARAARAGIMATAREQLDSYRAWLKRRKEQPQDEMGKWEIDASDLAAFLEVIVEIEGADAAVEEILGWTPRFLPLLVAEVLVPQLLASGKVEAVHRFLSNRSVRHPWSLALMVPLALAGEAIDRSAVDAAMRGIRPRLIPDPTNFESFQSPGWKEQLFKMLLGGCELGFLAKVEDSTLLGALENNLAVLRLRRPLIRSDFHRIDGLARCWILTRLIAGEHCDVQSFLGYVEAFTKKFVRDREKEREPQKKARGRVNTAQDGKTKPVIDEDVSRRIKAVFGIYVARGRILASGRNGSAISEDDLQALQSLGANAYEVDHDYDSGHLRGVVAESVMLLQMVPGIDIEDLLARAVKLSAGRFDDSFGVKRLPLWQIVRLRNSEAAFLVKDVAERAASIEIEVAASSEKVEALIKLSRLLLHVSRDDAGPVFDQAITIAKELDREAIDQIDAIAQCALRAEFLGAITVGERNVGTWASTRREAKSIGRK